MKEINIAGSIFNIKDFNDFLISPKLTNLKILDISHTDINQETL